MIVAEQPVILLLRECSCWLRPVFNFVELRLSNSWIFKNGHLLHKNELFLKAFATCHDYDMCVMNGK